MNRTLNEMIQDTAQTSLINPSDGDRHLDRRGQVEPLVAADRAGSTDLVNSVRVWLSHHGQWEPAATQLGVHRHTLRKRIGRAGELLGRDLDSPGVRAELWLALHPPTA